MSDGNRRKLFSAQLKDLQADISTLSEKMEGKRQRGSSKENQADAVNISVSSARSVVLNETATSHAADFLHISDKLNDSLRPSRKVEDIDGGSRNAFLQERLEAVTRERDELKTALQNTRSEAQELRRQVADSARLQIQFDHLRQDLEAMKVSLDSSERIRKQQKSLIALIQKSQSALDGGSISGIDNDSVTSAGSTIASQSFSADFTQSHSSVPAQAAPEQPSVRASSRDRDSREASEHRSWLSASPVRNTKSSNNSNRPRTSMPKNQNMLETVSLLSMSEDSQLSATEHLRNREVRVRGLQSAKRSKSAGGKPPRAPVSSLNSSRHGVNPDIVTSLLDAIGPRLHDHPYQKVASRRRLEKTPAAPKKTATRKSTGTVRSPPNHHSTALPPRPPPRYTSGTVPEKSTTASRNKMNSSMLSNSSFASATAPKKKKKATTKPGTFGSSRR